MRPSGAHATGFARVCAWKSRLLGRREAASLMLASNADVMQRTIATLALEHPIERLTGVYRAVLRSYPDAAPLVRSLLLLHEIENLKLLWRAVVRRRDRAGIRRLWIPLGTLATIPIETLASTTLREATERLAKTPFQSIAQTAVRAFGDDLGPSELAFDRWASRQLLDEAGRLPNAESLTRRLIEAVIRERDAQVVRRGLGAQWTAGVVRRRTATDVGPSLKALCHRAFAGDPFAIAPAIALIVMAEAELRAVRALIERCGDASLDEAASRVMAGSELAS